MPEPIIQPAPGADDAELATLRRVNAELLKVKHDLKARIATLEGEAATLESKCEKATAIMQAAVIDRPLKKLAAEISNAPELFIAELRKDYDVAPTDEGGIALLSKDGGKVVTGHDGKPLEVTHLGLYKLLAGNITDAKNDREKVFGTLIKYIGSSGGAGRKIPSTPRNSRSDDKPDVELSFGLR